MQLQELFALQPIDNASALHAEFYNNERWLKVEQERVFSQSWQLAGHVGELNAPGDHVVCEIAGKPILIVRNAVNELRAFYNVCRHRAGPLALCSGKGAKSLQCKYHGWTYTLDGQLRSATEMQSASHFDVSQIRLPEVKVREWQGLIFVALSDNTPDFDAVYGGIVERIQPLDLQQMKLTKRVSYELECNWKVYIDNFLEGYHLPFVHPGLNRVLDYRSYDTELFEWYSLQHSPLRNNDGLYADGHAFYYFVYPNIMLNILPGRLQTNRILPKGLNRCIVEFDYFYTEDPGVLERMANEQKFADEIQEEDIGICERVQKGLNSGSYTAGRLNPQRESGVWHFQNLLRTAYATEHPL